MPSKTKAKNAAIAAKTAALPKVPKELLDQIAGGGTPMSAEQINATTMALKKALIERALAGELTHHLGYAPGASRPEETNNHRNGVSARPCRPKTGRCASRCPETARAATSRS